MPESSSNISASTRPEQNILEPSERERLRADAIRVARSYEWIGGERGVASTKDLLNRSAAQLNTLERRLNDLPTADRSEDLKSIYENLRLIHADIQDLESSVKVLGRLPGVGNFKGLSIPRSLVLARALITAVRNRLTEAAFSFFLEAVQEVQPLRLSELWGMLPALKLVLVDEIAGLGVKALHAQSSDVADAIA